MDLGCLRLPLIPAKNSHLQSPDAVRDRILDADCQAVITADESVRGGKRVPLKVNVEKALQECPNVHTVITVKRTGADVAWTEGRDIWYDEATANVSADCAPEPIDPWR